MFLVALTAVASFLSAPDPNTRGFAWRLVDTVAPGYNCELACSKSLDANRDTACLQAAVNRLAADSGLTWNALELPAGTCQINQPINVDFNPHVNGGFEIFGHGPPSTQARNEWGHSVWNSNTVVRGTVLRATAALDYGAILTLGTDYLVDSVNITNNTFVMLRTPSRLSVNDFINIRCGSTEPCVLPEPLDSSTGYYVQDISGNAIKVSAAPSGPAIDLTTAGLGTVHISNSGGGRWKVHDLAFQGYDGTAGTEAGLAVVGAGGAALIDFDGVVFANLPTGLECYTCEDGTANSLGFYGNGIALFADQFSNSNVLTGLDCGANNVCGVIDGGSNLFNGGTIQGSYQYGFRVRGGENRFSEIYFEDQSTVGGAISLEKVSSWVVTDLSTTTEVITLDGKAPPENTQVYLWVDGSSSAFPTSSPQVVYGTAYFANSVSENTLKLRTLTGGGGSLIDFSTVGTLVTAKGRTRMTVAAPAYGYANIIDNNHYSTGDSISVWSGNNQIDELAMGQPMVIQKGVAGVWLRSANACTDLGDGSVCESFSNGGLHFSFTNPVVAAPGLNLENAASLFFGMQTDAGMEFHWECRDVLGYCQFRDTVNNTAYLTINPHGVGTADDEVAVKAHVFTVDYAANISGTLTCNTIDSTGGGTTVEGVLLDNGLVDTVDVSVLAADVNNCPAAVGNGVSDDSSAIQACISATPVGGTLFLPAATYYLASGLVVTNPIEILGQGVASQVTGENYVYGSASWASASAMHGTVFKTANSSGTILQMTNNDPRFIVRNVAFWGTAAGAPTTTGIVLQTTGGNEARPIIDNVSCFNMQRCVQANGIAGDFRDLFIVGNQYGLDLNGYGHVVTGTRAENNTTAILLESGAVNTTILGGQFKSNTTAIDVLGGRSNRITGVLFNSNTTALKFEKSGGNGTGTGGGENIADGNIFITNDAVSVYSSGNHFEFDGAFASPSLTLQSGAAYNWTEYLNGTGGSYTDSSGQSNFKTYQSANGLEFYDSAMVALKAGVVYSNGVRSTTYYDTNGATGFVFGPGDVSFTATPKTDTLAEKTSGVGVTVDGAIIKDSEVRDSHDVRYYGALCDGVTNDQSAIQAAITANANGYITIPAATCVSSTALTSAATIEIRGDGTASTTTENIFGHANWASAVMHGSTLKTSMTSGALLTLSTNTADSHFVVRDLALLGTGDNSRTTKGLVLNSTGSTVKALVDNVAVYNFADGIECTAQMQQSDLTHIAVIGNSVGINITNTDARGVAIRGLSARTNVTAVLMKGNNALISGGYIYNSSTLGIDLYGTYGVLVEGVTFNTGAAITIEKSSGGGTGSFGSDNILSGSNVFLGNEAVSVYGNGNQIAVNSSVGSPSITLQSGASYNTTTYNQGVGGSYTDSSGGTTNNLITHDASGTNFAQGLTAEGVVLSSGDVTVASGTDFVKTDLVSEFTTAAGVTVDSVLLKDGAITLVTNGLITAATDLTLVTPTLYVGTAGAGALTASAVSGTKFTATGTGGGNTPRVLCNSAPGTCTTANCTTTGTAIETVATCNVPSLSGGSEGDTIVIDAIVLKDADANSVTFEIDHTVGGTPVEQMVAQAQSTANLSWVIHLELTRDASTTMTYMKQFTTSSPSLQASTYVTPGNNAWTWANSNNGFVIRLTTGVAAGDASVKVFRVVYYPAVTSP